MTSLGTRRARRGRRPEGWGRRAAITLCGVLVAGMMMSVSEVNAKGNGNGNGDSNGNGNSKPPSSTSEGASDEYEFWAVGESYADWMDPICVTGVRYMNATVANATLIAAGFLGGLDTVIASSPEAVCHLGTSGAVPVRGIGNGNGREWEGLLKGRRLLQDESSDEEKDEGEDGSWFVSPEWGPCECSDAVRFTECGGTWNPVCYGGVAYSSRCAIGHVVDDDVLCRLKMPYFEFDTEGEYMCDCSGPRAVRGIEAACGMTWQPVCAAGAISINRCLAARDTSKQDAARSCSLLPSVIPAFGYTEYLGEMMIDVGVDVACNCDTEGLKGQVLCPQVWQPVCAEGTVYDNPCHANLAEGFATENSILRCALDVGLDARGGACNETMCVDYGDPDAESQVEFVASVTLAMDAAVFLASYATPFQNGVASWLDVDAKNVSISCACPDSCSTSNGTSLEGNICVGSNFQATAAPSTAAPTTAAPTTAAPTTAAPAPGRRRHLLQTNATAAPTNATAAPTTAAPTNATSAPTTAAPTTAGPTTAAPAPTLSPAMQVEFSASMPESKYIVLLATAAAGNLTADLISALSAAGFPSDALAGLRLSLLGVDGDFSTEYTATSSGGSSTLPRNETESGNSTGGNATSTEELATALLDEINSGNFALRLVACPGSMTTFAVAIGLPMMLM